MRTRFQDRAEAGKRLATQLRGYEHAPSTMVIALPRGGLPVAYEVARALHLPLDITVVRKLGAPRDPELAIGAIAEGGVRVLNNPVIEMLGVTREEVHDAIQREWHELGRRERRYRPVHRANDPRGRIVIVVDDGLATGSTMLAAVMALRIQGAARIVVAVPVADHDACRRVERVADECICLIDEPGFRSVGDAYETFPQVGDEEAEEILRRSEENTAGVPAGA